METTNTGHTPPKKTIRLYNRKHGTSTMLHLTPIAEGRYKGYYHISWPTAGRLRDALCGDPLCDCGEVVGGYAGDVFLHVVTYDPYTKWCVIDLTQSSGFVDVAEKQPRPKETREGTRLELGQEVSVMKMAPNDPPRRRSGGFRSGIDEAVYAAGSQVALADLLGCSSQNVSIWVAQGWVPLRRAIQIEAALGVPRRRLIDPDLVAMICQPPPE